MKKIVAVITAAVMLFGMLAFSVSGVYYKDDFPNTHRNTGKNLADFIAVAKTQIGYTELSTSTGKPLSPSQDGGYTKYGDWFGAPTVAWCAFFVSWCSNQAGISSSVIPRIGNCEVMTNWYKNIGRYFYASQVTPRTGDLIFYNWSGGSVAGHIGIVTGVSGNSIYTVEGNTGSSMGYRAEAKTRTLGAKYIIGYARPAYNDASTYVGSYSFSQYAASKYKTYQNSGNSTGSSSSRTAQLAIITSSAEGIGGTDATLAGRIENSSSHSIGYAGFFFGKDKNNMKQYGDYYGSTKRVLPLTMEISKRYGKLEPATKYYFCAYASVNGRTYKGPVYSFTTVDDRPQQIVLSEETASLISGETYELMCAVLPLEAQNAKVKWSSDNERAVTVKDGLLTGKGTGYAVITAKCDYGNVAASCDVSVILAPVKSINGENISYDKIKVAWSNDNNPDVFGYEIYRSEVYTGNYEKIGDAGRDAKEFVDDTVQCGNYYCYKIRSIGVFEDFNSELSEAVQIKAVPSSPSVYSVEQEGICFKIIWNEIENADKYVVYRSLSPYTGYSPIGTVKDCCMYDMDIAENKTYYYRIAAYKDKVQSNISDFYAVHAKDFSDIEAFSDIDSILQNKNVNQKKPYARYFF